MNALFLAGIRGFDATDLTEVFFVGVTLTIALAIVIVFGVWWNH